jgi:hypothetical protein
MAHLNIKSNRSWSINAKTVRPGDTLEPPQLNWSAPMFRKRRTKNGKQATEARRDRLEITAG